MTTKQLKNFENLLITIAGNAIFLSFTSNNYSLALVSFALTFSIMLRK